VDPLERFAANMKALRAERGWSQEALADRSGLHSTAISKLERCARSPEFQTVVTLATAFEVPAGRLWQGIP
jgi:transcriptional regulator with XRE-family HTH domain